jgi:hypothetical protein
MIFLPAAFSEAEGLRHWNDNLILVSLSAETQGNLESLWEFLIASYTINRPKDINQNRDVYCLTKYMELKFKTNK